MIRVTVHGAEGRMGRLVTSLLEQSDGFQLAALVTAPGRQQPAGTFHARLPLCGQDELARVHPERGVIVDFSLASALEGLLAGAARRQAALVVGTTGHSVAQQQALAAYAKQHTVVMAANFSVGISALQLVLAMLAQSLPPAFAAEEVETHHNQKLDKPSGTARLLAETWQKVRGGPDVPIHSLRLGGIVGEHAWTISDQEETIQIVHRAHSRRAFLRGLPPAIRFAAKSGRPGLYSLADVLTAQARQERRSDT